MFARNLSCKIAIAAAPLVLLSVFFAHPASPPAWKPQQNVEIVVSTATGSGSDAQARQIQRIFQERRLVDTTVSVLNKPGGGGAIGLAYLNQHAGNGHYLMVTTPTFLTNYISGRTSQGPADVTPLAQVGSEYVVFAVRADSRFKTGADLAEAFRKDPAAVTVALANALGNHNHIAASMVMKAVGGDVKKLKVVVFNSSGEVMTSLLGGHVDVIATSAGSVLPHQKAGKARMIAVSSERRLSGELAEIPTWTELGVPAVSSNWRSMVGPKGMTAGQIRYWDEVFGKLVQSEEWRKFTESRLLANTYLDSAAARKLMDAQHAELRTVLTELGLVK